MSNPPQRAFSISPDSNFGNEGWTSQRVWSIFFIVLLTEQATFAYQIVTVALPDIATQFQTSQVSWVAVLTGLAGGVSAPLLGKAADIRGKKRMILIATALAVVGSFLSALAPNYGLLLVGRALQGMTFAVPALSISLVRDIFPRRIMPLAASLVITGIGAITIVQPFLSGWLVGEFGFRGVFWFLAIYSTVCGLGVWRCTPESTVRVPVRLDWWGAILLGLGVGMLLLALSMGGAWGWVSAETLGVIVAGIALLVGWLLVDRRVAEPLTDLRLLRSRPVATTILSGGLFYGGAGAAATVIPLMVMTPRAADGTVGFGVTPLGAAVYFLPLGLGTVGIGFVAGLLLRRTGARGPAITGCLLALAGMVFMATMHATPFQVLFAIALLGIGQGLFYAAMPNLLIAATPVEQQAITASMMQCFQALVPTIATQIVFTILVANVTAAGTYTGGGYTAAYVCMAVFFVFTVAAAIALPHGRRPDRTTVTAPVAAAQGAGR